MFRRVLFFAALIALLILTRVPSSREPVPRPLPARDAWKRAEWMLAQATLPDAPVYLSFVHELEMVCGDPAGATFVERTLAKWPDFEPARRAREIQAIREGRAPPREPRRERAPSIATRR